MKTLFALLLLLPICATAADSTDQLLEKRLQQVSKAFLSEANKPGSEIHKSLEELREFPSNLPENISNEYISLVEIGSEICAHPEDSVEQREVLVVLRYLAYQQSNFDEDGNYRSNTAGFSSKKFVCQLNAKEYGSKSVKVECKESN